MSLTQTFQMATKNEDDIEFLAPENFSMVETGVYRSAFPRTKNIEFLKQLNLKSVVSLVPEDYPVAMQDFYSANGIKLIPLGLDGNKWPFKEINHDSLQIVLDKILDPANRPLLIHCNKGKHRTGSVVGSLRRIRGWALSAVFTEYLLFASPKTRLEDQQLIETFQYAGGNLKSSESAEGGGVAADVDVSEVSEAVGGINVGSDGTSGQTVAAETTVVE